MFRRAQSTTLLSFLQRLWKTVVICKKMNTLISSRCFEAKVYVKACQVLFCFSFKISKYRFSCSHYAAIRDIFSYNSNPFETSSRVALPASVSTSCKENLMANAGPLPVVMFPSTVTGSLVMVASISSGSNPG